MMRWIIDHVLWETRPTEHEGFRRWLWATWKLSAAVVVSALLTWSEWVEHHPPAIALIALIHFVFVLLAIAIVDHIWRWLSRGSKKSRS